MRILLALLLSLRVVYAPDDTRPTSDAARRTGDRRPGGEATGELARAARPTDLSWSSVRAAMRRVPGEIGSDAVLRQAAAAAFYLALALVPLAVAAFSVFGLVASPDQVASTLDQLATLPGGVAELVLGPARDAASAEGSSLGIALVIGLATALWTASAGTKALMEAIGIAYDETEDRGFLALRGTALVLTVLVIAVLGGSVAVVAVADGVARSLGAAAWVGQVLRFPILLVGIVALLAALYRYGPDRADARWSWVSPGAVVAAMLWLVITGLFTIYVDTFGSYDETYGSLAGAVVLLLWLQLTAATFLLGAEVNAELERQTMRDTTTGPSRPMGERGAVPADHPPGREPAEEPDEEPDAALAAPSASSSLR